MAFNVFDRVQETTTTTGTGTVTLGGAVSGFQSFFNAGFNNGDTTYYCITSGTAWEVGLGTFTTGPNSLARTTILSSSNFNSAITLAGTSNVFCVYPASKSVYRDSSGNVAGYNLTAGTINSTTVGATSASTGAFTTLSASSTVSGTGFSTYLASPPAIGATSASTGAFTTLSASSTVSGTGFSTYLASPPAIGGTAAAAGSFTTLSASSTVSGTGFSTYLASPPAIGGTTAAAGSFTTLSASSTLAAGGVPVSGVGFSNYLASPPAIGGTTAAAITGTTITATTAFSGPHNGTVGATTPNTGAFTTLSASSTVSGTGFSTYLASPPAIGGTTASTIRGTTITATTAFSGPLNGTVGATTPSTGDFTTLSASSTLAAGGVPVSGYSLTVRSTALANAYFVDTDSGASGMNINFLKNSASPAASDDIANLRFYGNDSAAVQTEYVRLAATIADPTNGSEDGTLVLNTIKAGTVAERVRYSSADGLYVVDGAFRCPDAYASTTGTAANMVMSSASGILQRSTSSLRYKNSVENATYGLTEVMQLRPVTYKGNNDGDTVFGGFIAEEVHDIGLSPFVQYDEQNRPDALAYGNMVSLLTKAVQEQQAMIEDLKARIAVLEAR